MFLEFRSLVSAVFPYIPVLHYNLNIKVRKCLHFDLPEFSEYFLVISGWYYQS
jgi:hypothetical protein